MPALPVLPLQLRWSEELKYGHLQRAFYPRISKGKPYLTFMYIYICMHISLHIYIYIYIYILISKFSKKSISLRLTSNFVYRHMLTSGIAWRLPNYPKSSKNNDFSLLKKSRKFMKTSNPPKSMKFSSLDKTVGPGER